MERIKFKALSYISRILGLNHVKFTETGLFLFNFPMFLIPINNLLDFYLDLKKHISEKELEKILLSLGIVQGEFAINHYFKKFNIEPKISNSNYFLEQVPTIGLGSAELIFFDEKKKEGRVRIKSNLLKLTSDKKKLEFDYYLNGLVLGFAFVVFKTRKLKFDLKKISKYEYELSVSKSTKEIDTILVNKILSKYNYTNLSYPLVKNYKKNFVYSLLKKKNSGVFKIDEKGFHFYGNLYFFSNMGVFSMFNYYLIRENKNIKNCFYTFGKNVAKFYIEKYSQNLNLKDKFFLLKLFSLTGLGSVEILNKSSNFFYVKVINSAYYEIFYKLFGTNNDNSYFFCGFLDYLFFYIFKRKVFVVEKGTRKRLKERIFEIRFV